MPSVTLLVLFCFVAFAAVWRVAAATSDFQPIFCDLSVYDKIMDPVSRSENIPQRCADVKPEIQVLMRDEESEYVKFVEALETLEAKRDPAAKEQSRLPEKLWTVRHELYEQNDVEGECLKTARNQTLEDESMTVYQNCLIGRRKNMRQKVEEMLKESV